MRQPLAYRLRPDKLDDILGQEDLFGKDGVLRKCVENDTIFSSIFFGPPGCGKTTSARVIASELKKPCRRFNAVTGNKKDLDAIFLEAKMSGQLILICDEVHRLNKDKQDLLLLCAIQFLFLSERCQCRLDELEHHSNIYRAR